MLTLLILRNPKKWHCFFQPLIKIFHFSIVLKNSKTTKKFKLGIFQKSGWFWNLSHLSAQNWHKNKGKVWQDKLYIQTWFNVVKFLSNCLIRVKLAYLNHISYQIKLSKELSLCTLPWRLKGFSVLFIIRNVPLFFRYCIQSFQSRYT